MVSTASLFEILISHYFHTVLLEKGVSNKGSRRIKQEANDPTNPIQDSRVNLLEEGGNDIVQPCDTTQARSSLDFSVKFSTVQFYAIKHNSKSNCWIMLVIRSRKCQIQILT